jgi:hypothetical protein
MPVNLHAPLSVRNGVAWNFSKLDVTQQCCVTVDTVYYHRMSTTTEFKHGDQVTRPGRGTGVVLRMIGHYLVEVQWPGLPMTRREPVEKITAYIAPPAPVRRRRLRAVA